jgi:pimeloyl-ACP methyl ester carboxylesterase
MSDPVIKPQYLAKFQSAFFKAQVLMLDKAGHFPQEEQPDKVASRIQEFLE